MTDSIAYISSLMTASSHHAQQTYGMNVLYTAVSHAMHGRPCIYFLFLRTFSLLSYVWYLASYCCNNVGMDYWQYDVLLVCIHSRSYLRFVARPKIPSKWHDTTKYHRKQAYFWTSTSVPYVVYGTVRTRMIHTTGTHCGSSYRMIPAAFHGHTLTVMRVPSLQNEDSSFSKRECNTSNTAGTPNSSDVCTDAACCGYCLCSGLCTANHILLVYQY